MQFKNPEILYALLLLLIPIIVHLFQFRRFKKVAFTNVQFLKNITLQTRKSSQLKKWITLITRLLLLACIVLAFAQPYQSSLKDLNIKKETVIYLDNSFSMQATGANGSLLNTAIQDLIEHIDDDETFDLFTNNQNFPNANIKTIKNDLIQLSYAPNQLDYDAVILKGEKAFSKDKESLKNFILISDFQQQEHLPAFKNDSLVHYQFVQLQPKTTNNISVDSLYISKTNIETLELTVLLGNQGEPVENLSVSLFEDEQLIAKSAVAIDNTAESVFTIPNNTLFKGKITIDDIGLNYDNTLYFNLDSKAHINVLVINEADESRFLGKLYTPDEFNLNLVDYNALSYNTIMDQNLVVLNGLKHITNALITTLSTFVNDDGSVLIIPSNDADLSSYNQLFTELDIPHFISKSTRDKLITTIHFSHPLLTNVFEKKVDNFQYPKVNSFYGFAPSNAANILGFEDGTTFLAQSGKAYVFTAALNEKNSNFKNSPLIVPVLYNIGKQSIELPLLYYTIGINNTIDIKTTLKQDDILKLQASDISVIPFQQTFNHKVQLTTDEYPDVPGIFEVKNNETTIQHLSYNHNRKESNLNYMNLSQTLNKKAYSSVASAIDSIKSSSNIYELWKWFVIFALVFLIIEMLILKFLK